MILRADCTSLEVQRLKQQSMKENAQSAHRVNAMF
jgi:hypothetical protein